MDGEQPKSDLASKEEVARVSKLIDDIKKLTSGEAEQAPTTTIDLKPIAPIEEKLDKTKLYLDIKNSLSELIYNYLQESNVNFTDPREEILRSFDSISDSLPISEAEISIDSILGEEEREDVRDLFLLLENELKSTHKKLKIDQIKMSNTKVLDRADLETAFKDLGEKIVEEEESQEAALELLEDSEVPYPNFLRVLFALLIDFFLVSSLSFFTLVKYYGMKFDVGEVLSSVLASPLQITVIFFIYWFLINGLSLIYTGSTLGHLIFKAVIVDLDNRPAPPLSTTKRLSLHILNFLSMGLYSLIVVQLITSKGMGLSYCPISKTRLGFRIFLNES